MRSLSGSVAVVTGAATGIGKGIGVALAEAGAVVGVNHLGQPDGAADTLARVRAAGSEGMLLEADVRRRSELGAAAERIAERFGRLDIWVNNAGVQPNLSLLAYDPASLEAVLDTNVKGCLWGIQAAAAVMKPRGYGRIVNISSVHGKRPSEFDPVYAISKGAMTMLVREAAIELGRHGITVNVVEPGAVFVGGKGNPRLVTEAPLVDGPGLLARRLTFPLGRPGLPADIGRAVVFLASREAESINGAALRIDGTSMLL